MLLPLLVIATAVLVHSTNLTVTTRTGTFLGGLNDTYPDVRHFKYIPYALPPTGPNRWTSPHPLPSSSTLTHSTTFGPSCAQYVSAVPSVWALNVTGNLIMNYGESLLAGLFAQNSDEDCLSMAIWTPANVTAESGLPVLMYFTGGGDVTGGINIPTQLPAEWIHSSQKHIMITTNYRVNIFSNPHARGLHNHTNFAMQDQRVAIEWVYENVREFGGDPERITIWGQSAGSGMVDMYLARWYDDPIVKGAIMSSAFAIGYPAMSEDYQGVNFTFVAKAMGCDFEDGDGEVELECMRRVPAARIENFVGQYQDNSSLVDTTQPAIKFTRQVDNTYIFPNYTLLHLQNHYAPIPTILGTTSREFSALLPYSPSGPSESLITSETLTFVCGAYNTSLLLNTVTPHIPTYRYQWAGNFTNISPVPWLGAYHYSDLYMFFGTYLIAPGEITELERETARRMQGFLEDFLVDPWGMGSVDGGVDGGVGSGGGGGGAWPEYDVLEEGGGKVIRFGADGEAVQIVSGDEVDGACHNSSLTYDTTP